MEAALSIFAEKGFQAATISEISKEAGVSEATVYEHFGTKEDLLLAIPEQVSNDGYEQIERVLPYIHDTEGRIRVIMQGLIQTYQTNPDYSALILLQLLSNKRFRQTEAHAAIRRTTHSLLQRIKEGIQDGTFRKDTNPYLVRSILLGTVEHLFIHWHMKGKPNEDANIMDLLDPFFEIVMKGIRAKDESTDQIIRLKIEDIDLLKQILQPKSSLAKKDSDTASAKEDDQKSRKKNAGKLKGATTRGQ